MQNENHESKSFVMYLATISIITKKLQKNIEKNGGQGLPSQEKLDDIVCQMIYGFSSKFFSLGAKEKELQESDFEKMNNVINEGLLSLSGTSDLLPSESLLTFCAKEITSLMYFTHNIIIRK